MTLFPFSSNKAKKAEEAIRKMRSRALREGNVDIYTLPQPLKEIDDKRIVRVFVEGYDDVAFWRGIFDHFSNPYIRFEISVPPQHDLPKGKKVLLSMVPYSSEDVLLCMDSDFDYLLSDENEESRMIVESPYLFHTYTYATENYLCYAPSLHDICVKATKNDTRIFDFKVFMAQYSKIIYPAFVWYVYSASKLTPTMFPLADFKQAVRIGYLDITDNGKNTLEWLGRHVTKCVSALEASYPEYAEALPGFISMIEKKGVTEENVYLFMHGHTLMDNVVLPILSDVCEKLRQISLVKIVNSSKVGEALDNEIRNYNNSLRSIRDVLLDNENYTSSPLFEKLKSDIQVYIDNTIARMTSSQI